MALRSLNNSLNLEDYESRGKVEPLGLTYIGTTVLVKKEDIIIVAKIMIEIN